MRIAGRLGLAAAVVGAGGGLTAGLLGGAAGATTQDVTTPLTYTCTASLPAAGISLPNQSVAVTLVTTVPTTVASGSTFTVSATSSVGLPSTISSLAGSLGITGALVTSVQATVDASGASPASTTVSASGLPLTLPASSFNSGVAASLDPVTLTAGAAGTATISAGALNVSVTVQGGSLNGDASNLTCTPPTPSTIATVPVTPSTPAAPVVASVSPSGGPAAGGTSVTIAGSGFTGATAVHFGSASATFSVGGDGSITATSPAGTAGSTVDVTVTGPGGTSATSPGDAFAYAAAPPPPPVTGTGPTVTRVWPSSGPASAYTLAWVLGTGLSGVTGVQVGGQSAMFRPWSATALAVLVPPGVPGTVDVTVTTAGGTSPISPADQFTYEQPHCFWFFCFGGFGGFGGHGGDGGGHGGHGADGGGHGDR